MWDTNVLKCQSKLLHCMFLRGHWSRHFWASRFICCFIFLTHRIKCLVLLFIYFCFFLHYIRLNASHSVQFYLPHNCFKSPRGGSNPATCFHQTPSNVDAQRLLEVFVSLLICGHMYSNFEVGVFTRQKHWHVSQRSGWCLYSNPQQKCSHHAVNPE